MDDRIERLARLIVDFGANVQAGQLVDVAAGIGEEELVHAVAARAYRRGARFVDVGYFDPWLKRARVEHVADELLEYIPPWYGERVRRLGEAHACAISLTAPTAPEVFRGLDPRRLGRDIYPRVEGMERGARQADGQLVRRPVPDAGVGQARLPAARARRCLDRERVNNSQLHLDFMIGSSDVAVTGITRDGERAPVLRDGVWAL